MSWDKKGPPQFPLEMERAKKLQVLSMYYRGFYINVLFDQTVNCCITDINHKIPPALLAFDYHHLSFVDHS